MLDFWGGGIVGGIGGFAGAVLSQIGEGKISDGEKS